MNLTATARDTSLERGIRTIMEGKMPIFMKFEGSDGSVHDADGFDFSQLTTEPTGGGGDRTIPIESFSWSQYQTGDGASTDLSYSVEILGVPATMAEYGILLAI